MSNLFTRVLSADVDLVPLGSVPTFLVFIPPGLCGASPLGDRWDTTPYYRLRIIV